MDDVVIRVENLSKRYRIGRAQERHDTLRDALTAGLRAPLDRLRRGRDGREDEDIIWALRDVSFEVKRGEVVGIIGRNGAGKSTLLKILSRITEPTEGRATIHGRVGSLLEVGTGFHPELTGRENIYLSGAILGMHKVEIDRKLDEIIDFSGVERFIDTPFKRYSSGMRVRLGFSVAAHLDPEILLVDEVLAVGDAAFQKRCMSRMEGVAHAGRTVVFVSHNMTAIQSLCANAILLRNGMVRLHGRSSEAIRFYLGENAPANTSIGQGSQREGSGAARFSGARLVAIGDHGNGTISTGDTLVVELDVACSREVRAPMFGVRLHTQMGMDIAAWRTQDMVGVMPPLIHGGRIRLQVDNLNLLPGVYGLALGLSDGYETVDLIENALTLEVIPAAIRATGTHSSVRRGELVLMPGQWEYDYH